MADDSQKKLTDLSGLNDLSYQALASIDIFTLLGAAKMPEEKKKELEEKIMETIKNRVIAKINDMLNEHDVEEWEKLGDDKEKEEFLASKGIIPGKMMLEEALIYKMELVALAKPMRDKLRKKD